MDIIKNISVIFISIFFESLPFLLLGSIISSVIETYVSNEIIEKMIPKNPILGSLVGVVLGFFIPACDCAVIPVTKRLMKKKVPINVCVSFMLASPIINPVVLLSTFYAFYKSTPNLFWYRLLFGILIALIIGIIMGIAFRNEDVIKDNDNYECHHIHKHGFKSDLISIIKHSTYDLFEVVKYLMLGALLCSVIQVLLPRSILVMFNNNPGLAILALMIFAYLISLCSTSDSFVGKSLASSFGKSSILAYLLLGPMIDIKNTIVLAGNYKKEFVATLVLLIFIVVFIFSFLAVNLI